MKLIFWGILFLFLDFSITIGNSSISILPAFAGYIMIYVGMGRVSECRTYGAARPMIRWAAVCAAVIWVLNCLGVLHDGFLSALGSAVSIALQLFTTYHIARGVLELEQGGERPLNGSKLMMAWRVVLVSLVLSQVLAWLGVGILAMLALLVFLGAAVCYTVLFYGAWKACEG